MAATIDEIPDDVTQHVLWDVFNRWKAGDDAGVRAQLDDRRQRVGRIDGHALVSSGTNGRPAREYRWGPNFFEFHEFCANLFTMYADGRRGARELAMIQLPTITRGVRRVGDDRPPVVRRYGRTTFIDLHNAMEFERPLDTLREIAAAAPDCRDWCLPPALYECMRAAQVDPRDALPAGSIYYSSFDVLSPATRDWFAREEIAIHDTMRCWDGGATMATCPNGRQHWIDMLAAIERDPQSGRLSVTDLWNCASSFTAYTNGDAVEELSREACVCGLPGRTGRHVGRIYERERLIVGACSVSWHYPTLIEWLRTRIGREPDVEPALATSFFYDLRGLTVATLAWPIDELRELSVIDGLEALGPVRPHPVVAFNRGKCYKLTQVFARVYNP